MKTQTSPEQAARDMLDRMGVKNAQSFSAGDVVELANLLTPSALCWTLDDVGGESEWKTTCHKTFIFGDGDDGSKPSDYDMEFCCYCGRPIEERLTSEHPEDR